MVDNLITALSTLGYPVRLQGSFLADEPYPAKFFTFWNNSSDGDGFYSNTEGAIIWNFTVNFYSDDPSVIYSTLLQAKEALKASGWVVSGAGYSVMSDEPTHTGRGIEALYREQVTS